MTKSPDNGSAPYVHAPGEAYFAYQNRYGRAAGRLDHLKIRPYVSPSDRVLDFGCGGGWLLAELDCAERTGVEINPSAREVCADNGVEVVPELESLHGRTFDVIVSHHSLEHVGSPLEVLVSLGQLLEPDGRLVLVVPIDDWQNQKRPRANDPDHHLYTWTPRLLANLLHTAGYTLEEIRILHHAWFPGWHRVVEVCPDPLFHAACGLWSRLSRTRQLLAVGTPRDR